MARASVARQRISRNTPRSAPKAGYDNPIKAAYRRDVWSAFRRAVPDLGTGGKVLILPSSEGLELDVASDAGVHDRDMIAVDRNPAIIATAKWRKTRPEIVAMGQMVADVGPRIRRLGATVRIANVDLCATVSAETIDQLKRFIETVPTNGKITIAVTIAKGREDSLVASLLRLTGQKSVCSDARMSALLKLAGAAHSDKWRLTVHAEGAYVSGHHPMAWCVFTLEDWSSWYELWCYELGGIMQKLNAIHRVWPVEDRKKMIERAVSIAVSGGIDEYLNMPEDAPDRIWTRWAAGCQKRLRRDVREEFRHRMEEMA